MSAWNKGLKMSKDFSEKVSLSHKGIKYPNRKRIKLTESHKKHISNGLIGNKNSVGRNPWNKGLTGVQVAWNKGKKCEYMRGDKHPNWRGGISRYYSENWYEIRKQIYIRDKFTCQGINCKNKGKRVKLDVHHIDNNPRNNDMTNLISLCKSCHVKETWSQLKNASSVFAN